MEGSLPVAALESLLLLDSSSSIRSGRKVNKTTSTYPSATSGVSDLLFEFGTCCSDTGDIAGSTTTSILYNSVNSRYRHRPFQHQQQHPQQQQQHQHQEPAGGDPLRFYCQQQHSVVESDSSSSTSDSEPEETKKKTTTKMTDPLNASGAGAAEEDDLDALLAQADSMISAAGNTIIDGFAIDSDEENEDNKIDDDIVDVGLDSPSRNPNMTTTPLDGAPKAPVIAPGGGGGGDPLLHPLHEDVVHHPPAQPTPQQQQQQRPHSAPSSGNHMGGTASNFASNMANMTSAMRNLGVGSTATGESIANQFKAQTSGFAANLSSMAQRVASAASNVTPTGAGGMGMNSSFDAGNMNNFPQPMSVPQQQQQYPNNNSPYGSKSNSMHGMTNGAGGQNQQQQPQQQQQQQQQPAVQPMMNFELDNEQKTALVELHVSGGALLPGERVIMFLHNLLHVSDSTGFQYAAGKGSPVVWCCAMTYYRLILFGTTQDMILYVMNTVNNNNNNANNANTANSTTKPPLLQHSFQPPNQWNASCWPPAFSTVLEMPLASMEKCEKTVYTPTQGAGGVGRPTTLMGLQVWAKDGRFWRLTTPSYADTLRAHQALLTYAFPGRRNLGYLFAFESKRADVVNSVVTDPTTGQKTVSLALTRKRFDAVQEFTRQFNKYASTGSNSSPNNNGSNTNKTTIMPWKIWTQLNSQYQLCMSYPNVLVGPASLDEQNPDAVRLLQSCAAFRSEQRLPALSWASGMDGASIWRCSQPKVGLQGNRSSADELVMKHIMEAAKSANLLREQPLPVRLDAHLLQVLTGATSSGGGSGGNDLANTHWVKESKAAMKILDLRPRSAAMANRTGGYGYENTSYYPGTTLQFCNIGNIHAVRDSYQKMSALCLNMTNAQDVNWGSALEDTKWLSHIRIILAAAWETVFWVHVHRLPVVLHCSHGWDRTSQVSALAQLMLDPYYRTMEGFACLMEKDFMSFGHPFHTRCAHGEGKGGAGAGAGGGVHHQDGAPGGMTSGDNNGGIDEGQISPIFLQFLDCVWQIVNQYPECFEFTTEYVLELSDHIYSCRFGNVLCDTERERELVAGIRQRTYSVWDHLEQDPATGDPRAKRWRNKNYDPSPTAGGGVLLMPMPTLLRNVTLWKEKHARYGPLATLRWRNTEQSQLLL